LPVVIAVRRVVRRQFLELRRFEALEPGEARRAALLEGGVVLSPTAVVGVPEISPVEELPDSLGGSPVAE
jgi:hypothetical protein